MELKHLFADEDAVSPVIGVILMVAITVILAAVIGTFVLGLGENVQDSAPQANFQFEYNGSAGSGGFEASQTNERVTITHTGGEDVPVDRVTVQFDGTDATITGNGSDWSTDPISTGTSFVYDDAGSVDLEGGESVRVVWTSPSGGTSNTIGQSTVPN